jgi:hypothetical protein|tara:strand:+ start:2129 stop:2854 length:726 start_codon:yes stop_codon:yes gene_type:complete
MKELEGKNVAIVAMGQSQIDFHLSQTHSVEFDEIWAINAMIGVLPNIDRAFILDPMSRFLDTEDAGTMTPMMRKKLPKCNFPIYTCELDERVPCAIEYPLELVIHDLDCSYFNNTIPYAIAFALWSKVKKIFLFGVDFTYRSNMHFAEAGRSCTEFWLSKCIQAGIQIEVAPRSSLLDVDIPLEQKLYGYHRLDDPKVAYQNGPNMSVCKLSEIEKEPVIKPVGIINRNDLNLNPVEPSKY